MTGKNPRKKVDALYWQGRLRVAQAYLEAAQQAHLLAEVGQDCNPVISQIVLAAIAFGDSLTAKRAQVVNQQDHAQAPRLLRDVLGNLLPDGHERRYRRILSFKDEVHHAQAPRLLRDVLGNLLPDGHERRYRRIRSFKDEVQYGTRQATRDEAGRLLADLEELARWAQELL